MKLFWHWCRLAMVVIRFGFTRNPVKTEMVRQMAGLSPHVFSKTRKITMRWIEDTHGVEISYDPAVVSMASSGRNEFDLWLLNRRRPYGQW